MASAPDLPESIIVGQVSGIRNTTSEERLQVGEMSAAVNIDLDDTGQVRRRRGYRLLDAAHYHSLRRIAGRIVAVRNGVLGLIYPGGSFSPLIAVGDDPMSYTNVGETIYFSSRTAAGKIVGGEQQEWGERDMGTGRWLSPVMLPTETLGEVAGKLLGPPPLATELEHYKGRIYLAVGRFLWFTELYLYDQVDKTRNVLQFEHDLTMIAAVENGLYVGTTEELFFLQGTASAGLKRSQISATGVARGSRVDVPTAAVHPAARNAPVPEGTSPVFLTADGICVGLDSGEVFNLTRGRVVFPVGGSAAALYREDQGANAYVAVVDSGGSPNSNARIGDYVDAEIIRASQGD